MNRILCFVGMIAALGAMFIVACSRTPAVPPPDQTYTVRGLIVTLPKPDKPASELSIRHEPVPAFVNRDGAVVGMDSMEMPFTSAPGVSLADLHEGDAVEFTFEVRWKATPFSRLTMIRKLPAGTAINLGKAK